MIPPDIANGYRMIGLGGAANLDGWSEPPDT